MFYTHISTQVLRFLPGLFFQRCFAGGERAASKENPRSATRYTPQLPSICASWRWKGNTCGDFLHTTTPTSQKENNHRSRKHFFVVYWGNLMVYIRIGWKWIHPPVSKNDNPKGSMYGIFTYIYHKNQPNVGKYTIHGSYGNGKNIPWWKCISAPLPFN